MVKRICSTAVFSVKWKTGVTEASGDASDDLGIMGARRHGQGGHLSPPENVIKCFVY